MTREERRLRDWVSRTLTVGMAAAVGLIGVGIVAGVVSGAGLEVPERHAGPLAGILAGKAGSIVLLGILLLTLTPVAQLMAAAWAFARAGEHRYLVIALMVLGLLLGSLGVAIGLQRPPGG